MTGGHIYPALAVAQEIEKFYPLEALFVGSGRGAEKRIYDDRFPFEHVTLKSKGSDGSKISYIYLNSKAFVKSLFLLKRFHPDFVFTTGGYVGGIVAYAAHILKIPIFLHESNVEVGMANKKITPYAIISFCAFEQSKEFLKNPFVSGTPVREDFFFPKDESFKRAFPSKTVLIFGGSEGSNFLDESAKFLSSQLKEVEFIHVGKKHVEGENVVHFDYIDDMAYYMRNVDVVISRAGASTLAELIACKVPSILVPWKGSMNSHQMKNARYLEKLSAAFVMDEQKDGRAHLKEMLEKALDEKVNSMMRKKLESIAPPISPAKIIAQKIISSLTL